MPFYAVKKGRTTGIFLTWNDCNEQVKGFPNAIFKKFNTKEEANKFILSDDLITTEKNNISSFFTPNKVICHKKDFIPDYYVYTDGSCLNNGKDNSIGGIGIFFGINDERNISQRLEGKQTNNTAELIAIIKLYSIICLLNSVSQHFKESLPLPPP
jgi:ribonuclease HI